MTAANLPVSPMTGNGQRRESLPASGPASDYDDRPPADGAREPESVSLPILTAGQLIDTYPHLRPPLIDGLLRQGETMNIIAAPKIGKSWLSLDLALSVTTGGRWLDTFVTTQGNVLLIDNELHPETLAHRLQRILEARAVSLDRVGAALSVLSLRGRLRNLHDLGAGLRTIERGRFALIILDAFYRVLPAGTDENDNGKMAELYNALDFYADQLGASFALVHHASKGDQSAKAITDVGAGAGAQSRATDTHLILRPHEEPDSVILDAAVRSWPPVLPRCLRWRYPVWEPAPDLDPTALRQPKPRGRRKGATEPSTQAEPPWDAKRFAEAFGRPDPRPRDAILDDARPSLSDTKAKQLLKAAIAKELLHAWPKRGANAPTLIATVRPPAEVD